MYKTLITIDMQARQQFNLLLIFHPGSYGQDTGIVRRTAYCSQEGSIRSRLHDLTGITMVNLDIAWSHLLQIAKGLEVKTIVIHAPLIGVLTQHRHQRFNLSLMLQNGALDRKSVV